MTSVVQTRDMKLLPKVQRGILNIRRIHRKKIHERITALSCKHTSLPVCTYGPVYIFSFFIFYGEKPADPLVVDHW